MRGKPFYRFDTDSVKYSVYKQGFYKRFFKSFLYILSVLAMSVVLYMVFDYFFDAPSERKMKIENSQLRYHYKVSEKKLESIQKLLVELNSFDNDIQVGFFDDKPLDLLTQRQRIEYNSFARRANANIADVVIYTAQRLESMVGTLRMQRDSLVMLLSYVDRNRTLMSAIPAIQPLENADLTKTGPGYGYKQHPYYNKIEKFHYGIDFITPIGTPVVTTADGVISKVVYSKTAGGNYVIVDHGYGYQTRYMHLDRCSVALYKKVKRGDVIGLSGNSGMSSAPHLHYEVIYKNKFTNPVNFFFDELTPKKYQKIMQVSAKAKISLD